MKKRSTAVIEAPPEAVGTPEIPSRITDPVDDGSCDPIADQRMDAADVESVRSPSVLDQIVEEQTTVHDISVAAMPLQDESKAAEEEAPQTFKATIVIDRKVLHEELRLAVDATERKSTLPITQTSCCKRSSPSRSSSTATGAWPVT